MKKPIIYMAALTALAAASCTAIETNSQNRDDDAITQTENESPYYISLEQALISLDEFFQNTTKSSRSYTISDAFTVNNPSSTKLSAEENPTLLHIVNFEGEEGYAILSADIRIPSTVLAVTEKGSLTSDSFVTDTSAEFSPAIIVYRSAAAAVGDAPGGFDKPDSVTFDPPELEVGESEMTIIRWKAWEDIKEVSALLSTAWGQGSPYNKKIPSNNSAGCTTVAGAQVFAYNGVPEYINGIKMPYHTLKEKRVISETSPYADTVALLFYDIYSKCKPTVTKEGTLIWPKNLVAYMRSNGYFNVELYKSLNHCDMNRIYSSLDKGNPVIMSAKANGLNAHTWVVDGYVKQKRNGQYVGMKTGKIYGGKTEFREMAHCNWGWEGNHDGYYYSGVFDVNNPASYTPSSVGIKMQSESDGDYDSWYRIITYQY